MIQLPAGTRVFVAIEPIDLRQGFTGLYGLVQQRLGADPLNGQLYVFTNQRRNRLKVLYWDGSGLWVCTKRLEQGTFGWPAAGTVEGASASLSLEDFGYLINGLELRSRPNWYRRGRREAA